MLFPVSSKESPKMRIEEKFEALHVKKTLERCTKERRNKRIEGAMRAESVCFCDEFVNTCCLQSSYMNDESLCIEEISIDRYRMKRFNKFG